MQGASLSGAKTVRAVASKVWTAAELEQMSPAERHAFVEASIVADLDNGPLSSWNGSGRASRRSSLKPSQPTTRERRPLPASSVRSLLRGSRPTTRVGTRPERRTIDHRLPDARTSRHRRAVRYRFRRSSATHPRAERLSGPDVDRPFRAHLLPHRTTATRRRRGAHRARPRPRPTGPEQRMAKGRHPRLIQEQRARSGTHLRTAALHDSP